MRTWIRLVGVVSLLLTAMIATVPALAQGGTTITYGQVVTGEITNAAPEVRYIFDGKAGDAILISMTATQPGLDSYLQLLDPTGAVLIVDDDSGGNLNSLIGPYVLAAGGPYTIVATRFMQRDGSSTGPYSLMVDLANVNPLTLNETVTVELNDSQPMAFFSYASSPANQVFSLAGQGLGGDVDFNINVRDPFGSYVNGAYGAASGLALVDPLILSAEGSYIFALNRQFPDPSRTSGTVSVLLTLRPIITQPIPLGTPITGTLNDENPSDHLTFAAQQGDILRLAGSETTADQPFEVQVLTPEGYYLSGSGTSYSNTPGSFVIDPLVFDQAGSYLLLVRRLDPDGQGVRGTSNYSITLGPTETPLITAGVEMTGSFDAQTYEQVYRFEGTAGQVVRATLRSLDGVYLPSLSWGGPSAAATGMGEGMGGGGMPGGSTLVDINASVPGTASYETTLAATGVYLFHVRTGGYVVTDASAGSNAAAFGLLVEVVR